MKTHLKRFAIVCCLVAANFQLHSQGYIVPNGVVYIGYIGSPGYEIDVLHNPNATTGNYTGFLLRPQGGDTFQFDPIVDIGVRVFLVSANDPISIQPVLAHTYTELLNPNNYFFAAGSPFYVGLYTGNDVGAPQNGIYNDPLFGWAELENINGRIELLNSALEYQGGGIYTGTENIISVPEPATLGLLGLGALCFGLRRSFHKQHCREGLLSRAQAYGWLQWSLLALVSPALISARAQGSFQNLDFESALIDQAQTPGFVSVSDALPGWTVYVSTNQQATVLYGAVGHGGTLVDLLGVNGSSLTDGYRSIDGGFSVMLQGGVIGGAVLYPAPASILQAGLVPATSRSILFKAQTEVGTFAVSLDGINIPYVSLSNGPNYTMFAGDVSTFAGRTAELQFSLSRLPGTDYSNWNLDSIMFSDMAIPEPSVLCFSALGAFLLIWRFQRRLRRSLG